MKRINWNNAIYYGELFGFVFAWAVGIAIAMSTVADQEKAAVSETFADAALGGADLD
ncbi:MAG: hypothetical protein KDA37_06580 [Planctomycetales bacterium]|nr:hypothetical protein [Planctomycetales bacterium]